MSQFFDAIDRETAEYRKVHGLPPLDMCDCGKPATYLGMCNGCYHSAQISSKEEHSPESYRKEREDE